MVITFQTQEPDSADANQDATDFSFIQIGEPALAVVMRLQTRLPRIKVRSVLNEGGSEDGSL